MMTSRQPDSPYVEIRAAEPRDAPTLTQFNLQLAWESESLRLDPARVRPGVEAVLAGRAEARYWVATVNGELAGQLMLTREWSDWRNGWLYWIQSVFVAEPYRRRGLFRQLFHHARCDVESSPQFIALRLYVEEHNHSAQGAYVKLGLRDTGYRVMEWQALEKSGTPPE